MFGMGWLYLSALMEVGGEILEWVGWWVVVV